MREWYVEERFWSLQSSGCKPTTRMWAQRGRPEKEEVSSFGPSMKASERASKPTAAAPRKRKPTSGLVDVSTAFFREKLRLFFGEKKILDVVETESGRGHVTQKNCTKNSHNLLFIGLLPSSLNNLVLATKSGLHLFSLPESTAVSTNLSEKKN